MKVDQVKYYSCNFMYLIYSMFLADFVNFVTIGLWDEMFGFIMAVVVFISTLKFIKMLKFNKRMGVLGDTIKLAYKDLKVD